MSNDILQPSFDDFQLILIAHELAHAVLTAKDCLNYQHHLNRASVIAQKFLQKLSDQLIQSKGFDHE